MDYYVNENIKATERIFPMQGRYDYKRYDLNENPEGLPEEFVNSVLKEITPEFLAIYPEPEKFLKKYASFIGVKPENVMATNGSDMAIRYLFEVFGEKGKEVVTVSPTFEMYRINCLLLGLKHVSVSYNADFTVSAESIAAAINENTRIVALLNPNNPMGNVYSEEEIRFIISRAEAVGAIVIIDEAYHYFHPDTFLSIALEKKNVVILRTFSKLMSIAACRIGVIISDPDIIKYARRSQLSFDVNSIALLFAERLIERPDLINELIEIEHKGKEFILSALREHGYECFDCKGNFFFVKPRGNAAEVAKRLKNEKKVLVHPYGNELLKDYIRVSAGSEKAMKIFLEAFLETDRL